MGRLASSKAAIQLADRGGGGGGGGGGSSAGGGGSAKSKDGGGGAGSSSLSDDVKEKAKAIFGQCEKIMGAKSKTAKIARELRITDAGEKSELKALVDKWDSDSTHKDGARGSNALKSTASTRTDANTYASAMARLGDRKIEYKGFNKGISDADDLDRVLKGIIDKVTQVEVWTPVNCAEVEAVNKIAKAARKTEDSDAFVAKILGGMTVVAEYASRSAKKPCKNCAQWLTDTTAGFKIKPTLLGKTTASAASSSSSATSSWSSASSSTATATATASKTGGGSKAAEATASAAADSGGGSQTAGFVAASDLRLAAAAAASNS